MDLPVNYKVRGNVAAYAKVDHEYVGELSKLSWFLSSKWHGRAPRATVFRAGVTKVVHLNRLVRFLADGGLPEPDPFDYAEKLKALPKLSFLDGDPFNCQAENISAGTLRVGLQSAPPRPTPPRETTPRGVKDSILRQSTAEDGLSPETTSVLQDVLSKLGKSLEKESK